MHIGVYFIDAIFNCYTINFFIFYQVREEISGYPNIVSNGIISIQAKANFFYFLTVADTYPYFCIPLC